MLCRESKREDEVRRESLDERLKEIERLKETHELMVQVVSVAPVLEFIDSHAGPIFHF